MTKEKKDEECQKFEEEIGKLSSQKQKYESKIIELNNVIKKDKPKNIIDSENQRKKLLENKRHLLNE